jgi:hypothetical protein
MTLPPTREMLLETWQAIGGSEPLCHEMQNLCLMFARLPAKEKTIFAETKSCRDTACASESMLIMPPPQRRRRADKQMGPDVGSFGHKLVKHDTISTCCNAPSTSGIETCITGTGYLVRTGTYRYVLSTDRYRKSISVQTGTYRYVLCMYQNNVLYVGQQ